MIGGGGWGQNESGGAKQVIGHVLMCALPLQNKHGKSADFKGNFMEKSHTFPGFPRILKSVENDQSSAESMEIIIQLNVCHETAENTERGSPRILKSVENDQSSVESMEVMIQLNVCHESSENTERVEHNFGSFHGVTESVERVENVG